MAFALATRQPVDVASSAALAALHALAGLGMGYALSFTHGSIGRSTNPHRLFVQVNIALGGFAVLFLGGMPPVMAATSAATLFVEMAGVMATATLAVGLLFPDVDGPQAHADGLLTAGAATRILLAAWFVIGLVICLAMNQAMVFAFFERIGADRSFGAERVNGVLIALGLVNLMPGLLATWLQKKWSPVAVGFAGPACQAVLALTMSSAVSFLP